MLSDKDIVSAIENSSICIEPYDSANLQPSSYDFRLSSQFRALSNGPVIDTKTGCKTQLIEVPDGEPLVIEPYGFILGSTVEIFQLSDRISGQVNGKSSLGRLGLLVHATAGFIDPGFRGQVTLELANITSSPMRLWPGQLIGQMHFFNLSSRAMRAYGSPELGSHYQGQMGPTESRAGYEVRNV